MTSPPSPPAIAAAIDPAARRPDAFLSYSRRDGAVAARLTAMLGERGKDVWVDTQDIPAASRWRDELARAIEAADAVIALVTPAWVASPNCREELNHADAAGKRIIPVLAAPVESIPEALTARQWVDLPADGDWTEPIGRIVAAIDADLPYVRAHARYLEESQRWTAMERDRGFLLRGRELAAAETWLATRSEGREPTPTAEQLEFIQSSRADATRRLRILFASVAVAAVVAIALGAVALLQRNVAVDREATARSRELAALSEVRRGSDPEAAIRLAVDGLRGRSTAEAEAALRRAIATPALVARFGSAGAEVDSAGITPDGETVIAATRDGVVRALAVADGSTRWEWSGRGGLQSVLVAADGEEVAVGQGGAATVLRAADGVPLARYLVRPDGDLTTGVISPDGTRVAVIGVDLNSLARSAGLWIRGAGQPLADLGGGGAPEGRPAFSADGALLALPYRERVARVWDGRTGELVHVLAGHRGVVSQVTFDPAGRRIATASADGTARLWGAATGRQERVLSAGDGAPVNFARFSPDGTQVAIGTDAGAVLVFDAATGRPIASLAGHTAAVTQGEFIDEATLVTGSLDASARVWDVARERTVATLLGHGLGVRVPALGRAAHLLTTGDEGTARVWRLSRPGRRIGEPGATARLSIAADGRALATSNADELTAALWAMDEGGAVTLRTESALATDADASDAGVAVAAIAGLRFEPAVGEPRSLGPGQVYAAVRVASGGSRVAGRRVTGAVDLFDTASGERIATLDRITPLGALREHAFSADGRRLAVSESTGPIVVLDAATGREVGRIAPPGRLALAPFAIDATGRRIFRLDYGFREARPVIADIDAGTTVELSGEPASRFRSAEFSPDGGELLVAGGGAAQLWDTATGALRDEFGRGLPIVTTAAHGAGGRLVLTGHADGLVRAWDRPSGGLLGEFDAGTGEVTRVASGFGGARVFAVGADLTLRSFACDACAPAADLVGRAREHVAFGDLAAP